MDELAAAQERVSELEVQLGAAEGTILEQDEQLSQSRARVSELDVQLAGVNDRISELTESEGRLLLALERQTDEMRAVRDTLGLLSPRERKGDPPPVSGTTCGSEDAILRQPVQPSSDAKEDVQPAASSASSYDAAPLLLLEVRVKQLQWELEQQQLLVSELMASRGAWGSRRATRPSDGAAITESQVND